MKATDAGESARAWVKVFAEGWRAPTDPDSFTDHFAPWLQPDYKFAQPVLPAGTGLDDFRERFARPLFSVVSGIHATVEDWASRDDRVFITMRFNGRVGKHAVTMRICDLITLIDDLAAQRETYADVSPLILAVARTPRLWWRAAHLLLPVLRPGRRST